MKLRKNIYVDEIECNCGCGLNDISPAILDVVQWVRDHFDKPVLINDANHSACRCVRHNKNVGGSEISKHLPDETGICRAIDFHVEGVSHKQVYDAIVKKYSKCLGVGLYSWGIHVDDRMTKAYRW